MTSLEKSYEGKELGCHFPLGFVKEMRPLTDPTGRSKWFSRRKQLDDSSPSWMMEGRIQSPHIQGTVLSRISHVSMPANKKTSLHERERERERERESTCMRKET